MSSACAGNSSTSTGGDESLASSIRSRSSLTLISAGFVALLLLAVTWPDPVRWVNEETMHASLSVSERSFLGREAPSWDMIFWAIAGLYALALLDGRVETFAASVEPAANDLRRFPASAVAQVRRMRGISVVIWTLVAIVAVAATWRFLDAPLMSTAEAAQSDLTRASIRFTNRLGGGMNPVMIVLFFGLAGMAYGIRRWWLYGMAMSAAAIAGGVLVQCVKFIVGRARPELWLGPFHYVDAASSSFPSGHTVGAFAIAAVLMAGSSSRGLRWVATLLAVAIGASRILAFRHWPSDVLASALIGLALGWFFASVAAAEEEQAA
jgi:membrane-associated phospholipid phosphatase